MKFKHFLLISELLFPIWLGGQINPAAEFSHAPTPNSGYSNLANPVTVNIQPPVQSLRQRMISAKLYIKLDLGEFYALADQLPQTDFKVKLDYTVNGTQRSLVVTRDNPEQWEVIDILANVLAATATTAVTVNAKNIYEGGSTNPLPNGPLKTYIENRVRFAAASSLRFATDVRMAAGSNNMTGPVTVTPFITLQTSRTLTFQWAPPAGLTFPNYEIQVLRLFNADEGRKSNPNEIKTQVDWSRALRVETQSAQTFVKLTVAEGSGFYIWRVRPVGAYLEGGIANSDNYGPWSVAPLENEPPLVLNKNSLTNPAAFYLTDPDDALNWIYSRVFTEGNDNNGLRVSEGMTYADGLLHVRQNQAYNADNDSTLVTQTIPDFTGRPAWVSLPAPVAGNLSGYKMGFVQTSNLPYTATQYDQNNGILTPPQVDTITSAFKYYSDNNPDLNVPSGQGYLFVRQLFKNDGTGRLSEQAGAGKAHTLGAQTDGKGRTTRYLYCSASDDELLRIFGDEAPLAESVIKTVTIDPNNVVSVAYTSKEGKTIATGMMTASTDNLLALAQPPGLINVQNSTGQNSFVGDRLVATRRLAFAQNTSVTIDYQLDCSAPGWGSCIGGDCKYRVRFILYDLTRNESYRSNELQCPIISLGPSLSWTKQSNQQVVTGWNNVIPLDAGEYLFVKEVYSANPANYLSSLASAFDDQTRPIIDGIAGWMTNIDNKTGYDLFVSNLNLLKGYLAAQNHAAVRNLFSLPSTFQIPAGFTLNYTSTPDNNPASLSFGTSCCGSPSIAITKPEICIPCELMKTELNQPTPNYQNITAPVNQYFIQPLVDKINEQVGQGMTFAELWVKIVPGFTPVSLGFMVANMLTSKYYTGMSKRDGTSGPYKAKLNDAGDLVFIDAAGNEIPSTGNKVSTNQGNTLNYDCKKLYEAWTAALNMINSFGTDNDINTMDAFNDDQGANTSEDHYDNKESRDEQKFNVLNFIISYKMRKFQNGEGKATKARQQSEANFPNLFMQAAGYQFAVILDELETMPTEYSSAGVALPLNNELPPTISTSYLSSNHGTYAPLLKDDSGVIETPSRLIYPYILRPEWMFKYFVYNLKDNPGFKDNPSAPEPDWSWLIPDHRELEIQTCYKPPCTNTPICFNDCRYFHESWSSGQRLNFYYMIKGAAVNPDSRVDPNDQNMFSNQTCPTGPDLLAKAEEQLAAYTASLESRSAEIRGQIVQMLLNSCYTIEDCASPGACQISNKMVDQMTAKTIQVCKDGVLKEVHDHVTSNAGGYPKCTKQDCYWPDNSGICQIKTQMIIEYFQPCDQLLLNQLSSWNFLPYMPKCPSANCTPPTPPPAGQPCSTTSQNSKAYQVSN